MPARTLRRKDVVTTRTGSGVVNDHVVALPAARRGSFQRPDVSEVKAATRHEVRALGEHKATRYPGAFRESGLD